MSSVSPIEPVFNASTQVTAAVAKQMAKQIKVWNRCHISLEHLERLVETFVENEAIVKEEPYSLV